MRRIQPWLNKLRSNRLLRLIAVCGIVIATFVLITRFFLIHPAYLAQLRHTPPSLIVLLLFLYMLAISSLAIVYDAIVMICGRRLASGENLLLTVYSTIINFFGPLQSGPGVRAIYLKTRHQIRLRDFTMATLLYYACYACISIIFLLVGSTPWWQTVIGLIGCLGLSVVVLLAYSHHSKSRQISHIPLRTNTRAFVQLLGGTFMQVLVTACIYWYELRSISPTIQFSQAMSYTGAANLAMFVSLTPGAIGFREAFLVFFQHFHHISTSIILAASVLDRGTYVLFLSLAFVTILSFHGRRQLLAGITTKASDTGKPNRVS